MNISDIKLKIKVKHLAEEARIIRHEENKYGYRKYLSGSFYKFNPNNTLREHRRWDVRNEARATQLARAMLKGKKYSSIESKRKSCKSYAFVEVRKRVAKMVSKYAKYGTNLTSYEKALDAFDIWIKS